MNILFLNYNRSDACSWYRSTGISRDLEKQSGCTITNAQWSELNLDWSVLVGYDIIMIQRPYTSQSLDLIKFIRNIKSLKIWLDYDDNLLALPPENDAFQTYNENAENVKQILKLADVISVTTEDLKQAFLPFNDNIKVIPNAFNDLSIERPKPKKREKIVIWRGTKTHVYDIMCNGPAINKACEQFTDWNFLFMGFYPWFLSETQNKGYLKGQDVILYFSTLFKMCPSVMQIPLHDNLFNRCKSNISALEGTFAGSVCVVPDYWNIPGTLPYLNPEQYYDALRLVLSGEIDIEKQSAESWSYIQDCLFLSKVNKLRCELINSLL